MRSAALYLAGVLLLLPALTAIAQERTPAELLAAAKALGDTPAARALAQKAADQGLGEAWYWLGGNISAGGDPTPYYAKAAELGYDKAYDELLDYLLFRAAEKADVAQAKKFGDLARQRGLNLGSVTSAMLETIDRCFEAGKPVIPDADRPALLEKDITENRFLAEVYANGTGVRRNPKLAIALICHGSDVPAELMDMVRLLYETRNDATLDKPFLFCEHVTSGMNAGVCAARGEGAAGEERDAAWTRLAEQWSEPQRAALDAMRTAATAFFEAHSSGEVDQRGTAHLAIYIDDVSSLEDALLKSVGEFEAGKLPAAVTLAVADAELNTVYAAIVKNVDALDLGTVTKESIRDTQRKWLAYRDAWAAFAARRYPRRSAAQWKAWLTTVRTAQLKALRDP